MSALRVLLDETPVGTLTLDRNEGCEFRLLESYKRAYPRPVLGQLFLDDPEAVQRSRARVPPWFSNLLPEGPLRDWVARAARVDPSREFFLLHHLGEDLPGAIRIVAENDPVIDEEVSEGGAVERGEDAPWHFSLAGVQLKFSARRGERGLTIPVGGQGGDWIVKLPDSRFSGVPENEHATMRWAAASGIEVPELELMPVESISGIPAAVGTFSGSRALAIRRFDRPAPGRRVHMEDFAQILGLYPEQKYDKYNYETLARVTLALTGEAGLDRFVRRLLFVIASGNGDAHHKNWSLIYPDGVHPELSPAYDLVSTIQYLPDDRLGLNLAKGKRWEEIGLDAFRRMARKIGVEERWMEARVEAVLDAILAAWREGGGDFGFDAAARERLAAHMRRVPLLADRLPVANGR